MHIRSWGGTGLTLTKSGDVHTFDNSLPMAAVRVAGTVYAAGTMNELSFPNATGSLTGQQLAITTSGGGSSISVASGSGIAVSLTGSVYTVSNSKQAPSVQVDGAAHSLPASINYAGFNSSTAAGVLTLTVPPDTDTTYTAGVGVSIDSSNVIANTKPSPLFELNGLLQTPDTIEFTGFNGSMTAGILTIPAQTYTSGSGISIANNVITNVGSNQRR